MRTLRYKWILSNDSICYYTLTIVFKIFSCRSLRKESIFKRIPFEANDITNIR